MELWDVMDANGRHTGHTVRRGERLPAGQYHLVVHIWITNASGHLLIQRRSPSLRLMPGIWAVTGGSAITGEDSLTAARRELREELGIAAAADELTVMGRRSSRCSHCDLWLHKTNVKVEDLKLQTEEVAEARWVSASQLMGMVERKSFHNYGLAYFKQLMGCLYGQESNA